MYLCVWNEDVCDFEREWVQYLLPKNTVYVSESEKDDKYPDTPCIFVISFWNDFEERLKRVKHTFGAIYLSEEILTTKMDCLIDNPLCKFIWRNYVHPKYVENEKVTNFPCSYKNGFGKYINNILTDIYSDESNLIHSDKLADFVHAKKYTWSFAGAVHGPERFGAINTFKFNFDNYRVHETPAGTFNASEGLSTEDYVKLIEDSKFVLCPPGKIIMECSRLYEALEAGAIPIVLANMDGHIKYNPSYHHFVFPKNIAPLPFIIVENWEEALSIIQEIEENETYTDILKDCILYWKISKAYWRDMIKLDFDTIAA
jgi:Exostosin family